MATSEAVTDAGRSLRDLLFQMGDDGSFSAAERDVFADKQLILSRALSAFAASPSAGSQSPTYDPAVRALIGAHAAAVACAPGDGPSIERLVVRVNAAVSALKAITKATPAATHFGLEGALAVRRPIAREGAMFADEARGPAGAGGSKPYLESLVLLFPVEAVALFPLAMGIAGDDPGFRIGLIAVILLFIVALRYLATRPESGGSTDWPAIAIAVVAFLLYAASLGGFGVLVGDQGQTNQLVSFVTIIFVTLTPFILRQTPPPKPV